MFIPMAFWIILLGGGFYVALRFVRALERRGSGQAELEQLRERLSRLEESVESVNVAVQRLSEAQQFTTRLLTERGQAPPP
jgi:prefoldin subunit 5